MSKFTDEKKAGTGFRVGRLFRMNSCLLERKVADIGLCYGQIPYILLTVGQGEQTQDEIAAQLHVNRAATARTLKNMEAAGLVTRKANPENRRQKLVSSTKKAEAIADQLIIILEEHNKMLFAGFNGEEKALLLGLFDRVIRNAEDMLCVNGGCDVQD